MRELLFGTRRRTMIVCAVVMVAVLGVSFAVYSNDQAAKEEPVEAMESFLEAVRDGDLDEAYKYVSSGTISDNHDNVLDPATYASDWEVGSIELVEFNNSRDSAQATVSTEIIGPGGTRVTDDIYMSSDGVGWVVGNPYSNLKPSVGEFRHLQVNGQQPETPAQSRPDSIVVLPGAYTFDEPDVDLIELQFDTVVVMGNERALVHSNLNGEIEVEAESGVTPSDSSSPNFTFDLREDAQDVVGNRIEHYLDNCLDDVLENIGCPLSISPNDLNAVADNDYDFDESSAQWEITEYPEVEIKLGADNADSPLFRLETVTPGDAELTVTAQGDDGSTELTFQCSFSVDLIEPTLEFDGDIYLGPLENPRDRPRPDTPVDNMDCELVN